MFDTWFSPQSTVSKETSPSSSLGGVVFSQWSINARMLVTLRRWTLARGCLGTTLVSASCSNLQTADYLH